MNNLPLRRRLQKTFSPILLFLLNGVFALVRVFAEGWRWWAGAAIIGALVLAGYAWSQPLRYRSEGTLTITPRYLLEGYMLATQELTHHYAVRLGGDERIERAMAVAGTDIEPMVEAASHAGMMVNLMVEHPNAEGAEALTRALLVDLRDEIFRENRSRMENDRLTVDVSLTGFARPATPPWEWYAGVGALGGFAIGVIWLYLLAFLRRGRLRTDGDVRQAVGLPPLGMIPRR
jgi:hypothetical protein